MDVIGPIVLDAVPFNWKQLAAAHPTMPPDKVPRAYRKFFSTQNPIPIANGNTGYQSVPDIPRYNLRPRLPVGGGRLPT